MLVIQGTYLKMYTGVFKNNKFSIKRIIKPSRRYQ